MGLDTVEFVIEVEKEFSIDISDDDAATLGIVGNLAKHICIVAKLQNNKDLNADHVFRQLKDMLAKQYGVPKENILKNSHFVKDLGLD